jgi:hypothetical protein
MQTAIKIGLVSAAIAAIGTASYASADSLRHVMPAFVIDVGDTDGEGGSQKLILIYGEDGSDPFLNRNHLATDQRISACTVVASVCESEPARREFGTTSERPQSLQIRLLNGKGNPILGGARWTGPWHPSRVRIACDLQNQDVRRSCTLTEVII